MAEAILSLMLSESKMLSKAVLSHVYLEAGL